MCCQPTEQLKFHPLRSHRATHNLTKHIRTRRKIAFKNRLASPPHVSKHCLPKMPPQQLINWSRRILKELLIKMFTRDTLSIGVETDDLVIILRTIS